MRCMVFKYFESFSLPDKIIIFLFASLKLLTHCMALPRVKFLSNPRRMHSKREGEEKGEQGLPRADIFV